MRERSVLGVDVFLIASTVALVSIGVLFVYSSGVTADGVSFTREWIRQIIWAGIGLVILTGISLVDYARIQRLAPYIYGVFMLVLVGTLLFGRVVNGARSWIGIGELGVQPSEFAKIATILFLAVYLDRRASSLDRLGPFAVAFLIALLPMGLVLLQPDLGTALVYVPVFLVMAIVAGARLRYVFFVLGVGALLIVFAVLPAWEIYVRGESAAVVRVLTDMRLFAIVTGAVALVGVLGLLGVFVLKQRSFGWVAYGAAIVVTALIGSVAARRVLQDYQLMRLIVFLDPEIDPRGAGWNIIQSVTAVGSGGLSGKGWLLGTQSHLQYLPQQSTDFIFSILAEEWGFLGAVGVFIAYAVMLARGLVIGAQAKDNFAVYVATGVVTMIFFHVAVNVGMAIGIMPITGIPLFFLSYGGSSLWTAMIGIGLLMSIYQHRYRY
jgi:rod shape determining protein RodA